MFIIEEFRNADKAKKKYFLNPNPVPEKLLLLTEYIPQTFLFCTDIEYT